MVVIWVRGPNFETKARQRVRPQGPETTHPMHETEDPHPKTFHVLGKKYTTGVMVLKNRPKFRTKLYPAGRWEKHFEKYGAYTFEPFGCNSPRGGVPPSMPS